MDRREFLAAAAVAAAAAAVAEPGCASADADEELSLADIAARFDDGRLSSYRLTQMYLDRIERLDRHGPTLSSVIEVESAGT